MWSDVENGKPLFDILYYVAHITNSDNEIELFSFTCIYTLNY